VKIIVSQQNKKILITFKSGKAVDPSTSLRINKADDFLASVDKFLKKRKMRIECFQKINLEFVNTGLLTERIIKVIILGLRFNT